MLLKEFNVGLCLWRTQSIPGDDTKVINRPHLAVSYLFASHFLYLNFFKLDFLKFCIKVVESKRIAVVRTIALCISCFGSAATR